MFQPRFRARLFLSLAKCEKMCYTYNAEDVRIRNLCADEDTAYTYNTNCKLSKLLCKTTNGVVTDSNGLIYMRARYYSPEIRRFINADIIPGEISNAITLNRYAYANGNPVSNIDPFGLSVLDWIKDKCYLFHGITMPSFKKYKYNV